MAQQHIDSRKEIPFSDIHKACALCFSLTKPIASSGERHGMSHREEGIRG
jgi:hypothetical protein